MEYYESLGDRRYLYFHKKMNQIMMMPKVIESMNKKVEENKSATSFKVKMTEEEEVRFIYQ